MNIVEPILAQCRFQPHSIALCGPGERHSIVTYAQIEKFIHNIAHRCADLGLKRGDTVVTFVDDTIMHALLILGLAEAGVISISGRNPDLPKEIKIDAIFSDVGRTYSGDRRVVVVDPSWMQGDGVAPSGGRSDSCGEDVCRIIFTSGTTGDAKGVAYSHRMVMERMVRFDYLGGNLFGASLRTYIDLGFATSLGYLFLIRTLTRGGMLALPGKSYEHVLNACDLYQVQSWIGAPGGLLQLVEYFDGSGGRRCNFQAMLAGGSLLSKSLSMRVRARACSNLISAYGSTETNMVATAPAYVTADTEGAVGYLTPGMVVEAVDEADQPLPPGREGLIRVRGPFNVKQYVGDPIETARALRNGWFYSGDIGSVTESKLLIIAGRQKTVMNIGGDKVKPEIVENMLTACAGVVEAGALSFVNEYGIEEIWAAIVPSAEFDELQLHAHCRKALPATFVPRRFIRASALPKNEMGKIDRRRLQNLALGERY
ncbi:MAG: class I adenylate-forming enzyme family protein [Xanthobacteraceae bacterium]